MNHVPLPKRSNPRPQVHQGMPHAQIGVEPVAEVNTELYRRAYALPDVENRPTVISVPGARALWLRDDLPLAHPEAIVDKSPTNDPYQTQLDEHSLTQYRDEYFSQPFSFASVVRVW